eukprot:scaffold89761_cov40-Prasinocladus_malaysianus.AAC.1
MIPQSFRSGGFAQSSSLDGILKKFQASRGPLKRFVLGSYHLIFGFYSLSLTYVAKQGAEVIAAYLSAGSPLDTKVSGSICHITFASLIVSIAEVQIGQVTGGPGDRIATSEVPRLGPHDQGTFYVAVIASEATWEPPYSARIAAASQRLAELLPQSKWVASFAKPHAALRDSRPHLRQVLADIYEVEPQPPAACPGGSDSIMAWQKLMHQGLSASRVPHTMPSNVLA